MIFKLGATAFGVIILFAVAVFAWMPSPYVGDLRVFPEALGQWFDTHDFERNVIGGAVLQLAFGLLAFAFFQQTRLLLRVVVAAVVSVAVFSALECMQLLLPRRSFDWMDIAASILGINIASGILLIVAILALGFKKTGKNCTKKDSNLQPID